MLCIQNVEVCKLMFDIVLQFIILTPASVNVIVLFPYNQLVLLNQYPQRREESTPGCFSDGKQCRPWLVYRLTSFNMTPPYIHQSLDTMCMSVCQCVRDKRKIDE